MQPAPAIPDQHHQISKRVLALSLIFTLAGYFLNPAVALAKPLTVRELQVGIAIAPSFKSVTDWKEKFKKRLAYASDIFEREFKVKFVPVAYWDWNPHSEKEDTAHLLAELREAYPLHGVDMVIGLTRLSELPALDQISDLHVIGRARPFSGYLVIRYPNDPLFKVQEETTLVHELGHLFGAIHTGDSSSIMAPIVEKQIPTIFDNTNRDVILMTREMDFKTGVNVLDAGTNQQLAGSYMKMIVHEQPIEFFYMLGVFYLNLGKMDEALKVWKKASDLDDENAQIHQDLGMLYLKLGHYKQASKELSTAVSGFHMPWQKNHKAEALSALGQSYLKEGSYLASYNAFNRAAAIKPDDLDIQINLAVVQLKRGEVNRAVKDLNALRETHPRNAKILAFLGHAYYLMDRHSLALETLEKALKYAGTNAQEGVLFEIYLNLGIVYLAMKDTDRAIGYFQNACRVNDSLDCHEQLGKVYFQAKRYQDAVRELAGVLQYKKEDAELYGILGVAFSQLGNDDQALGLFKEGVEYAQDKVVSARLHTNMGHLYMQKMHPELAEKEFQMALSNDWKNLDAHIGLAMSYLKRSNLAGARQALKTALTLNPRHTQARRLLGDIEKMIEDSKPKETFRFRGTPSYQ